MPRAALVPEGWNSVRGTASFRYSHPRARGKSFLVTVTDGVVVVVTATVVKQSPPIVVQL